MTVRALLFDFDGLIVETEGPAFQAWRETYERHGAELTLEDWSAAVGTLQGFDPVARLEELTGLAFDPDELRDETWAEHRRLVADEALRPGVSEYLAEAFALGLDIAVGDPVGGFAVTPDGLAAIGAWIAGLGLPAVIVQEGGYLLERLGANALAFLGAFA